ncbi:MAG TPA: serine/threonine-protein kinase [Steroidobacteraceae bacterium]|nr:serine/threonine-protein kinase [Steroidobacteraceae bacterium]
MSAYLDQALELEEPERAQWLAALGENDPTMAALLSSVLADREHKGFSQFLVGPAPIPLDDIQQATLVGRQVGPYIIEAEIGRGGMGSVWRARRADGRFEGRVAIKFVLAAWIGRIGEQRFLTEGKLLGRLDHPHIARLLDAGVLEATQPYLVLEYVDGAPIDAYCERRSLGTEARVRLFLDVLDAVAHAHSNLIVHRDLKPSNIFVTGDGTVKLLDFGIAKLLDEGSGTIPATQSIASALTPQYAAPEQLLGQPVTTATDTYALGCVLYLLLSGAHPFADRTRSQAEFIRAATTDSPRHASSMARLSTVPRRSLEGDLDNILHKSLKKDPVERYASAGAFAQDLRRYLDHMPVTARPDTLGYRGAKFVRRHRVAVALSSLTLTAILAGLVGTAWQAQRADANADLAAQQRERALQQLGYAEAANDFLGFLLSQGADHPLTTPELLARGERLVDLQFSTDPALRARMLMILGDLYAEIQDQPHAEKLLAAAQQAARLSDDPSLQIEADCDLAHEYGDEREFDKSMPVLDAAIARARAVPGVDSDVLATCLDERSEVRALLDELAPALTDARGALALLASPRPGQRLHAVSVRASIASVYGLMGLEADAVREYRQALDDLNRLGHGQTETAIHYYNQLALHLSRAGQWLPSAAVYEQGIAAARAVAGGAEVEPTVMINYAKMLTDLGRSREAMPLFDAAIASADHRGNASGVAMANLLSAPAWCDAGALAECAGRLERARAALVTQLPPGHSVFGTLETEAATLAWLQQNPAAARDHAQRALEIFEAAKDWNPNVIRSLTLLAEAQLKLGDKAGAAAKAADALSRSRQALHGFATSAWIGRAQLAQAEVYQAQGETKSARASAREALDALSVTAGERAPWTRQARSLLDGLPQ